MKEEIKEIKKFVYEHKIAIILLFIVSLFTYGFKIFHYSISIDTEVLISNTIPLLKSWIEIGRPILVLMKYMFSLTPFNPMLHTTITYFLFTIFAIFSYYIFYRITKQKNSFKLFVYGTFILTSVIYIEQLNFTLQSAEMTIAMNVFLLGILFLQLLYEKKKWYYGILSILCTGFAFGSYQSFVTLYISYVCLILFLYIFYKELNWKKCFNFLSKSILIFIICIILYFIGSKLSIEFIHSINSSYLIDKIKWFDEPIMITIKRIIDVVIKSYFGIFKHCSLFVGILYTIGFLFAAVFLFKIIITKESRKDLKILSTIILFFVPFSLTFLLGDSEVYRAQLSLPIVIGFFLTFLTLKCKNIGNYIINIMLILFLIQQWGVTNKLLESDYYRYQMDVSYANRLYDVLNKYDLENKRVVMLGYYSPNSPLITTRGETMGYSFFEWDRGYIFGVGNRAGFFMRTLGYNIQINTQEDYEYAKNYENQLEAFPKENCVLETEELIIVRLS